MTTDGPSPGWYQDPSGQPAQRWWDGVQWTDHVSSGPTAPPGGSAPLPFAPQPVMYAQAALAEKHPQTTLVFVLGLLGLLLCGILAPIAWGIGGKARREVVESNGRYTNDGLLTAGWIMGIIGTAFLALVLVYVLVVIAAVS